MKSILCLLAWFVLFPDAFAQPTSAPAAASTERSSCGIVCLPGSPRGPRASIGGQGGGGVTLTPFGLEIIRCYRAAAQGIESVARQELQGIASKALMNVPKEPAARRKRLARSAAGTPEHD